MARKYRKKTLKVKRIESFKEKVGMSPQEFLDNISSLPNHIRVKENIKEARALV